VGGTVNGEVNRSFYVQNQIPSDDGVSINVDECFVRCRCDTVSGAKDGGGDDGKFGGISSVETTSDAHKGATTCGGSSIFSVNWVSVFVGCKLKISYEVEVDSVVCVGSMIFVFINKCSCEDRSLIKFFELEFESCRLGGGGLGGAGNFFSSCAGDGGEGAGVPGDEPFALHGVSVFPGLIDAKGFAVEEEFHFVGIGVGPDGDFGAGFHLGMGPVREEVDHGRDGPLGLVKVVEVFFEACEIKGAAHEGAEGPAAVDVACFTGVVESGPAEVAGIPGSVTHDFPVLTGGDADHGVVVGGVEDLLPVGTAGGMGPVVGEDFIFGEIRKREGILALVREAIAEPITSSIVSTDLPGVRGVVGDEGFVLGSLVSGVEVLFLGAAIEAPDAVDAHVPGAGVA
jgi:hypothetical protein